MNTTTFKKLAITITVSIVLLGAGVYQSGCGATCKRIEKDRNTFLEREGTDESAHVEALIPFELAEEPINREIEKIDPLPLKLPIQANLEKYLGRLEIVPRNVELLPAKMGRVGFLLDFDVKNEGKKAFAMSVETDVEPNIDLKTGKVEIGLTPESFGKVEPILSKDAKKALGGMIYSRMPSLVRKLIPRSVVDSAAASVLKILVKRFYEKSKDKLLPRLGIASSVTINLPNIPARKLTLDSFKDRGGGIRLLFYSALPVRTGIDTKVINAGSIRTDQVSVRMSGSTVAELLNWAMKEGLVPDRYNKKGKPKESGIFQPGLDWIPGKRPMKIYLWQTERPCKRITLGADPKVSVKDDKVKIEVENAKVEDVDAAPFTELGVWFYALWKDAIDIRKAAASKMSFKVAGEDMVSRIERARMVNDELFLGISIRKE